MAAAKVNIAELVEQMPETDKEIQARKEAEEQARQADEPGAEDRKKEQPKPDRWGAASKFTGPEPEVADRLFAQALAGEKKTLTELIGLVRDPSDPEFRNYKPEYFLHGLAIYVSAPEQRKQSEWFVEALSSEAAKAASSTYVRSFLIRELRLMGTRHAVSALGKLLLDEQLCSDAAAALVSIGDGAADALRSALSKAKGKCRLTIVQSLGMLRDEKSVPALRKAVGEDASEVRLAAVWALAYLGDAGSVDALLRASEVEPSWERIKATHACVLLAENLVKSGKREQAARIYSHLRATRTNPRDRYLQDLSKQALAAMDLG